MYKKKTKKTCYPNRPIKKNLPSTIYNLHLYRRLNTNNLPFLLLRFAPALLARQLFHMHLGWHLELLVVVVVAAVDTPMRFLLHIVVVMPDLRFETDIVVREFAHLRIVDTDNLRFLIASKAEGPPGEVMHCPKYDRLHPKIRKKKSLVENLVGTHGHNERIRHPSCRIRQLIPKLNIMMIEPPASDDGDPIESRYARLGEETGEDVAYDPADGVGGEDVQGVVVVAEEFELGGKIAYRTSHDAEEDGGGYVVYK